jgi:hypothetical protein
VHRLDAAVHVAPGAMIAVGAAISLLPEIHHGATSLCVSRPDYPARFGLDPFRTRKLIEREPELASPRWAPARLSGHLTASRPREGGGHSHAAVTRGHFHVAAARCAPNS